MTTRMRMSRCRIRFDVFWCSAFFKLLAVCLIARIMTSDAQRNPQGFISIDCGSNSATYQDPETGLIWKNDGHYALTGMNGNISRAYSFQPNLTNHRALQSFRYFPENRGKHCYDLPLPGESTPFLIRAMFLYGASPQLKPPIQFGVYIDANLWFSLKYETDNATDPPDIREGIFYLPNRTIAHVCLVPTTGVPFISSLELRPLDSKGLMYSLTDNDHKALFFTTLLRCSANIAINDSDVRYPDDEYDRLWTAYLLDPLLPDTTAVSALSSNLETNSFVNYVPSKVMLKTWNSSEMGGIGFDIYLPEYTAASTSGTSGRYIYMTLYFYVSDADMGQNMIIYWNEETSHFDVVPSYINTKVFEHHPLAGGFIALRLESNSNPSLNAMEFYEEAIFDETITDPDTVSLIDMLKGNFSLTDWQGDPCTPVPYSWVACYSFTWGDSETLYVYSVTLSNVTNTSNLRQMSWPAYNSFSLSVIHSDVDDLTLETIMKGDHDDREYIYNMDFSYNKIKSIPISGDLLLWLNLSHNDIGGDFSSFSRSYNRLQYLNMSHNQLTSPPGNLTTGLESLHLVDFSYNRLTSEDSLETLVRTNALHLRHIDFSHNFLTGPFLSDLYISRLPRLEVLNFDQNSITGTLNLRAWSSMLRHAVKTLNISSVQKLFSLVNNSIQDIDPPAEEFQPLLETLIHIPGFNETGFLLGGNPYCQAAKLWTQRYFCRYSIFDQILELPEGDKVISKFLYAVIPGVLALIFVCVSIALSWKLWRQLRTLQAIQKAIAEREVQPRMYIYRDLKLATRNFHKENELGSGGFGAVYKGVLANGTTVAVKKLFNSQQKQVLHEFLNEVVLITGIKHKNLAQLKGCCITSEKRFLVYEFAEKGNLAEALWGRDFLDWLVLL